MDGENLHDANVHPQQLHLSSFDSGEQDRLDDNGNVLILSSNLCSLISPVFDHVFSDVLFYVAEHVVPLHRCILAARCPFFMSLFLKDNHFLASVAPSNQPIETNSLKLKIDWSKLFDSYPDVGGVSYEAFMTMMEFLYSGTQNVAAVSCIDNECLHDACRPVVAFAVDMLALTSVLGVIVLKNFWQNSLCSLVEKTGPDETILILRASKQHTADALLSKSLQLVAISDIGKVDVQKQLSLELASEVLELRHNMGILPISNLDSSQERACQRIRKALDSDDVELVRLLLKEGTVNLDQAHALHYAVLHCAPHTVMEILELRLVDVNLRNDRGFTPLHMASMRSDPSILVTLLSKGANPLLTTPNGRTAFQISSRMVRKRNDFNKKLVTARKDFLCTQILHQAETKGLFEDAMNIFPPTDDENELFMRLIYLENRIAVARLLFPEEAKLVTDICHLNSTSEFVGLGFSETSKVDSEGSKLDPIEVSCDHFSINKASMAAASMPAPVMTEGLLKRIDALQKSVIFGRKMFPSTSAFLNNFTDDGDPLELINKESGTSKEKKQKKRRFRELHQALEKAFEKDFSTLEVNISK